MTDGSNQGLFVVVAIVIFGIFILLSYLLFRDTLNPSLAKIYCDSFSQVGNKTGLLNTSNCNDLNFNENIEGVDKGDGFIYAPYRMAYTSDSGQNYGDIWIKTEELSDGSLSLVGISNKIDGNFSSGFASMGGEIDFSKKVDGKKITRIESSAFLNPKFTGDFNAPYVTYIGSSAFYNSLFTGDFNAPNLKEVSNNSFYNSKFSGKFNANSIEIIGKSTFEYSKFIGEFNAPSVKTIGQYAFNSSKFNENFKAPKVETINSGAFLNSNFVGDFISPNVVFIGSQAFQSSYFDNEFNANKVTEIQHSAFRESTFIKANAPELTSSKLGTNNNSLKKILFP